MARIFRREDNNDLRRMYRALLERRGTQSKTARGAPGASRDSRAPAPISSSVIRLDATGRADEAIAEIVQAAPRYNARDYKGHGTARQARSATNRLTSSRSRSGSKT